MGNAVQCYRQEGSINKNFTLTNTIVTPAPVGLLYDWVNQFPSAEPSSQLVYALGLVSKINSIATEAGDATFYISADGTQSKALYCPQTKWLDQADFISGNELAVYDTVVVLGNLQLADMTTPTMLGYVYDYRKGQPPVNTSLSATVDSDCQISVQGNMVHISSAREYVTYAYNLAGELVAMAPAAQQQTILLPHTGYYILRHGDIAKKIIIQ
jgi:hypothetical protein